jgi:hypothetical protein
MPELSVVGKESGQPLRALPPLSGVNLPAGLNLNQKEQDMTKTLEVISEAIRNPKHPFRKVDNQPKKPLKHRYERRKIRAYLQLGEWGAEEAA